MARRFKLFRLLGATLVVALLGYFQAAPGLADLSCTGCYQPVIEGSLTATAGYRYPLYRTPLDLIAAEQVTLEPKLAVERVIGRAEGEQFVPYYTRREIDEVGALRGR